MRHGHVQGSVLWGLPVLVFAGLLLVFPVLDVELEGHNAARLAPALLMALVSVSVLVAFRTRLRARVFSVVAFASCVALAAALVLIGSEEGNGLLLASSIVIAAAGIAAALSGATRLLVVVLASSVVLLAAPHLDDRSDVLVGWCVALSWFAALGLLVGAAAPDAERLPRTGVQARLRRMLTRRYVDGALDWIRFRIDTFPRNVSRLEWLNLPELQSAVYHELPWVGLRAGRRAESTATRWTRMRPVLESCQARSALDVGSNVGWFTFALADLGIPTIGVERAGRAVRIGLYAREKFETPADVGFLVMDVTSRNVELLPSADAVLFLSIWHHVVRESGLEAATSVLSGLWEKTGKVLFFESGEDEMPASWGLPAMEPSARDWLTAYLQRTCPGSRIQHLGVHDALGPDNEPCHRNLFAIVRTPASVAELRREDLARL